MFLFFIPGLFAIFLSQKLLHVTVSTEHHLIAGLKALTTIVHVITVLYIYLKLNLSFFYSVSFLPHKYAHQTAVQPARASNSYYLLFWKVFWKQHGMIIKHTVFCLFVFNILYIYLTAPCGMWSLRSLYQGLNPCALLRSAES